MERNDLDRGAFRTAGLLRVQLHQMMEVSCALEEALKGVAPDAEGRRQLARLNQGICRMLRIVGRIELTDRLGAERPRLALEAVDLARLVRELGEEMTVLLAGAGVELAVRCPERLPAVADEKLIRQLLLELVSNGAKAGGRVTVTLRRKGDKAELSVGDNGPGVPPEGREAMLSGDVWSVPDWRRPGNGVAIARRIAALHGGGLLPTSIGETGTNMVAVIPLRLDEAGELLRSPAVPLEQGGFSEALVGLSDLLPPELFAP